MLVPLLRSWHSAQPGARPTQLLPHLWRRGPSAAHTIDEFLIVGSGFSILAGGLPGQGTPAVRESAMAPL